MTRRFRNKIGFLDSTDFIETNGSGMSWRVTRGGYREPYFMDYERAALKFVEEGQWVEIEVEPDRLERFRDELYERFDKHEIGTKLGVLRIMRIIKEVFEEQFK